MVERKERLLTESVNLLGKGVSGKIGQKSVTYYLSGPKERVRESVCVCFRASL